MYWAGRTTIFPTFELADRTAWPDANWLSADAGIATVLFGWLPIVVPAVAAAGISSLWLPLVSVAFGATVLRDWLPVFSGTT